MTWSTDGAGSRAVPRPAEEPDAAALPPAAGVVLPVCFAAGLAASLNAPDIDQLVPWLLPHRSIVTHSLLLPWLLLGGVRHPLARHVLAGLSCGIAIHLSADVLSPMKGFALIHMPWPFSEALDRWASLAWIGGNALLGAWAARRLASVHAGASGVIAIIATGAALHYSLFHEVGILPFIVFAALYWGLPGRRAGGAPTGRRPRRD